jgi:hypothetical protein
LHLQTDDLIPVEGHSDLARDPNTGAVLNINRSKILESRERKRLRREKKKEQAELRAKVEGLENDISDMKNMLSQLIEKL